MVKIILSIIPFLIFALIFAFKPDWVTRLGLKANTPERTRKALNIFARILGIAGLLFLVYSIIYTVIVEL